MAKKYSTNDFILKAKEKHGNKYDYSLVDYKNSKLNVKIICPEHGIFFQEPNAHLFGSECPKCQSIKNAKIKQSNTINFINKATKIHKGKYDYSLVNYTKSSNKIKIICPEHGIFEQTPNNHLSGKGCPDCAKLSRAKKKSVGTKNFIKRATKIHNNKFDYSLVDYENSLGKVKIICPIHGIFEQNPGNHLIGTSCPKCSKNYIKEETSFQNYIKQLEDNIIFNDRTLIKPLELDIFIPDKKIAFEFNGLYWHSEACGKDKNYHINKTKLCEEQGIQLIHIFEDEWINKSFIVKSRIKHLLGLTKYKIFGRKCEVKEIKPILAKKFLNKYHIQGYTPAKVNLGLFYKNRLVACMTFSKPRFNKKYDWELIRYVTISNFSILGGASKLLKYFRKNNKGSIISYADKRWSKGNLYKQLGFTELSDSKPNYFYIKQQERFSRLQFQKHKLKDKLKIFDANLTETQNMINNNFNKIWDCGNKVYSLGK